MDYLCLDSCRIWYGETECVCDEVAKWENGKYFGVFRGMGSFCRVHSNYVLNMRQFIEIERALVLKGLRGHSQSLCWGRCCLGIIMVKNCLCL